MQPCHVSPQSGSHGHSSSLAVQLNEVKELEDSVAQLLVAVTIVMS